MAAVLVLSGAPACSAKQDGASPGRSTTTASTTPPLTIPAGPNPLRDRALTQADITSLPGAPAQLKVKSFDAVTTMQNPDPRGPCGTKLVLPSFAGATGVAITGDRFQGSELVVPIGPAGAARFVSSMAADTTTGCPPYTSTTSTGAKQSAVLTEVVPVEGLGDAATAAIQQVKVGATTGYSLAVVIADAANLALLNVFSSTPIDPRFARALADATAARLRGP